MSATPSSSSSERRSVSISGKDTLRKAILSTLDAQADVSRSENLRFVGKGTEENPIDLTSSEDDERVENGGAVQSPSSNVKVKVESHAIVLNERTERAVGDEVVEDVQNVEPKPKPIDLTSDDEEAAISEEKLPQLSSDTKVNNSAQKLVGERIDKTSAVSDNSGIENSVNKVLKKSLRSENLPAAAHVEESEKKDGFEKNGNLKELSETARDVITVKEMKPHEKSRGDSITSPTSSVDTVLSKDSSVRVTTGTDNESFVASKRFEVSKASFHKPSKAPTEAHSSLNVRASEFTPSSSHTPPSTNLHQLELESKPASTPAPAGRPTSPKSMVAHSASVGNPAKSSTVVREQDQKGTRSSVSSAEESASLMAPLLSAEASEFVPSVHKKSLNVRTEVFTPAKPIPSPNESKPRTSSIGVAEDKENLLDSNASEFVPSSVQNNAENSEAKKAAKTPLSVSAVEFKPSKQKEKSENDAVNVNVENAPPLNVDAHEFTPSKHEEAEASCAKPNFEAEEFTPTVDKNVEKSAASLNFEAQEFVPSPRTDNDNVLLSADAKEFNPSALANGAGDGDGDGDDGNGHRLDGDNSKQGA